MRIQEIEELEKLIKGHYEQLKGSFSVLGFIKKGNEILESEDVKTDFSNTETNIKYFCFLTSAFLDSLTTLKGFLNSKTDWENIYYSKHGFLTIYETLKTYNHYQKDFKRIVESEHSHLSEQYKEMNLILKKFKKEFEYDTKISTIRNKAAGHFDKDFLVYYEQIQTIDKKLAIRAIEYFLDFLKILMHFLYQVAEESEKKTKEKAKKSKNELLKKFKKLDKLINPKK